MIVTMLEYIYLYLFINCINWQLELFILLIFFKTTKLVLPKVDQSILIKPLQKVPKDLSRSMTKGKSVIYQLPSYNTPSYVCEGTSWVGT